MQPRIVVLNGPNLNLLGERQPEVYGSASLDDVHALCADRCVEQGFALDFRQSNHEGVLIDWVQDVRHSAAGLVLNAGGYTHTSVALRDAMAAVTALKVEVHISDIHAREPFRHNSYLTDVCDHHVIGHGIAGYGEAIDWIALQRSARR
ncbi:MAG: type II 3-dehydroquinate dehydratase [Phycicoccus sp.]|nr:type II 3-dehydroquinate dehydratase [Phycicoccus sp.]